MIRILHILEELSSVGGTPRKLLYLVRYANRSVQHEFLCMRQGDLDERFPAHATVRIVGSTNPWKIITAAKRLVQERRIDIISTHFTRAFVCGYIVSRLTSLPIIHNEHGPALEQNYGGKAFARLGHRLKRLWLANVEAVICNSAYTASTVQERHRLQGELLKVIHNPVETRVIGRSHRRGEPLVIGHIGGMIGVRDQATIIRAVRELKDRGVHARLVLIGDGPLRPSLEAEARRLEIEQEVEFRGYATDLQSFFDKIEVYVNAATAEGFGIAVAEAMLAGTPVVLADAGSHRELVQDRETGVLFEARSSSGLASALLWLQADASRCNRIAAAGQQWAARAFHPAKYARAYEDVLAVAIRSTGTRIVRPKVLEAVSAETRE